MNYQIKNIPIEALKEHEKICQIHLDKLVARIKKDGFINDPVIVDKSTMVILDGHHRYNSLKNLGCKLCPVCLVDYQSNDIEVGCWRTGEEITKSEVIAAGLSGKLLSPKTSRHIIPDRPTNLNIPLENLK